MWRGKNGLTRKLIKTAKESSVDVRSDPLTREETGAMFNESYWTNNRDGFRKYFKSFHHPSQYEFFPTTLYVIICFEWYPLKYSVPPSAPPLEQCVHCVFIIANIISAWRFIYYHNPMKLSEREGGDVGKREGGEY